MNTDVIGASVTFGVVSCYWLPCAAIRLFEFVITHQHSAECLTVHNSFFSVSVFDLLLYCLSS